MADFYQKCGWKPYFCLSYNFPSCSVQGMSIRRNFKIILSTYWLDLLLSNVVCTVHHIAMC